MLAKNTAKRVGVGAGMAAADSPMLPFGDIAALGMLGYGGVQDIKEAIRMWEEHQKRKTNK